MQTPTFEGDCSAATDPYGEGLPGQDVPVIDPLVHTIVTTGQNARPVSYRDFRNRFHTAEVMAVSEAYEYIDQQDGSKFLSRLDACKSRAYFHRHAETGQVRVISSCCRLRWCPFCAEGRKWRVQEEVKTWLPDAQRPKFLTLTLKHTDQSLHDQVDHLYKSFQKLRKAKYFKDHVAGGIWFFQVKQSKTDGLWHPHLHCLLDATFMPRKHLSKMWLKITGTSMVVDIRQVKDEKTMIEYVARYAAKPGSLSLMNGDVRVALIRSLHGRRLVGTWGSARRLSFRTVKPDDSAKWQRLANFTMVAALYDHDENARKIFNAWKTNQPLSEPLQITSMANISDDHFVRKRIRGKDCYGQCKFTFM